MKLTVDIPCRTCYILINKSKQRNFTMTQAQEKAWTKEFRKAQVAHRMAFKFTNETPNEDEANFWMEWFIAHRQQCERIKAGVFVSAH